MQLVGGIVLTGGRCWVESGDKKKQNYEVMRKTAAVYSL
jgi:hypothetical protein